MEKSATFLIFCCLLIGTAMCEPISTSTEAQSHFPNPIKRLEDMMADNCVCVGFNCGCCAHLVEKRIHLDNKICANATYLKEDYGFSLTVTFDTYTVFNETMSLRNPPPVCIGAPFVKEYADVCVRVYDIQTTDRHLHACVEVEAQMKHIHLAKFKLGCFNMAGRKLQQKESSLPMTKGFTQPLVIGVSTSLIVALMILGYMSYKKSFQKCNMFGIWPSPQFEHLPVLQQQKESDSSV